MQTIENLKELIKQTLLKNECELKLREHKEITDYAKDVGIDSRKLSKLIQEVDASINWEYLSLQETDLIKKEKRTKRIVKKRVNSSTSAKASETVITSPDLRSIMPETPKNRKKLITLKRAIIASCIVLLYIAIIVEDTSKTETVSTMFSYIEELTLRKEPRINSDKNIIGQLYYGDSLKVLSIDSNGWAHCVVGDKKGYVAAKYIMDKKSFYELDCIFTNLNTRQIVKYSYWRKGLLQYFNSRGIMGNLSTSLQMELYGKQSDKSIWQLGSDGDEKNHNTIAVYNNLNPYSSYDALACIIKNIYSGDRHLLLLGFQQNEEPVLLYETKAPKTGNIKSIYKTSNGSYKVKYTAAQE